MGTPPTDIPPPPPEATLIKLAREARGLAPEEASKLVPIKLGAARWRQIEAGYERRDPFKAARAPRKTLAHMAHALGVTAEQLRTVDRSDAAALLVEIERQDDVAHGETADRSEGRTITASGVVGGIPQETPAADRDTSRPRNEQDLWTMLEQHLTPPHPPGGWSDNPRLRLGEEVAWLRWDWDRTLGPPHVEFAVRWHAVLELRRQAREEERLHKLLRERQQEDQRRNA